MTFTPILPWVAAPDRTAVVRTVNGVRLLAQWPAKDPADLLDFSIFLHPSVRDLDDAVASFTVSAAPSDVTVQATEVNGGVLTAWLSGGVAAINYVLSWAVTFASGRILQADGVLPVANVSQDVGDVNNPSTPQVITSAMVAANGTAQSDAMPLRAQSIIIVSGVASSGVVDAGLPINAEIQVVNRTAFEIYLYPRSGAQFEAFGVNNPVGIASGGSIKFKMVSTTQGYVY